MREKIAPIFKFRHIYNLGDIIICLPFLKRIYELEGKRVKIFQKLNQPAVYLPGYVHPTKDAKGQHVTMNEEGFSMIKPLLEFQEYIDTFEVWEGETCDLDTDETRSNKNLFTRAFPIHYWLPLLYPKYSFDLSQKWLSLPAWDKPLRSKKYIVVNRTSRYTNGDVHYNGLKKFSEMTGVEVLFVGTENEYSFCRNFWNFPEMIHYKVDNFIQLARVINESLFFVGNASLAYNIAEALKVPRILEVSPEVPNVSPVGDNCYFFINQKGLDTSLEECFRRF